MMIQGAAAEVSLGLIRYYGAMLGHVVDNADPEGKHRVRIQIPGLINRSQWAWPLTMGGGSKQRGAHIVPDLNATVVVFFIGGNVEKPYYAGGPWSSRDEGGEELVDEMPSEAAEPSDAHKVQVLELQDVRITVDEREGKRALCLENKQTGDQITLDIANGTLTFEAVTAIILRAVGAIELEAASITINGRQLLASAAPVK